MQITAHKVNDIDIIQLEGRLDAYEVPAMSQWFDSNPHASQVIVNLSGVTFIDSSGLSTLVKGLKRCRQNEGNLYVCEMQEPVRVIFELTRLDKAFSLFDTEQAAVDAFAS